MKLVNSLAYCWESRIQCQKTFLPVFTVYQLLLMFVIHYNPSINSFTQRTQVMIGRKYHKVNIIVCVNLIFTKVSHMKQLECCFVFDFDIFKRIDADFRTKRKN